MVESPIDFLSGPGRILFSRLTRSVVQKTVKNAKSSYYSYIHHMKYHILTDTSNEATKRVIETSFFSQCLVINCKIPALDVSDMYTDTFLIKVFKISELEKFRLRNTRPEYSACGTLIFWPYITHRHPI